MFDFETNCYSATEQLISDAIKRSELHNETVGIRVNASRYEDLKESLLAECEGHNDNDLFWGDGWQIRLISRD